MMTKKEARKCMVHLREQMSEEDRQKKNTQIFEKVFAEEAWQSVEWFYPFVSYGTEADTVRMIRHVLEGGVKGRRIRIAVPRVEGKDMNFYEIDSWKDLKPGYHGIPEPCEGCRQITAKQGLMLLPGLAFDRQGNRVGYGGGYYDRYLSGHENEGLLTCAVAYDFQIVDELEADRYDIKPDKIITDSVSLELLKDLLKNNF